MSAARVPMVSERRGRGTVALTGRERRGNADRIFAEEGRGMGAHVVGAALIRVVGLFGASVTGAAVTLILVNVAPAAGGFGSLPLVPPSLAPEGAVPGAAPLHRLRELSRAEVIQGGELSATCQRDVPRAQRADPFPVQTFQACQGEVRSSLAVRSTALSGPGRTSVPASWSAGSQ